MCLGHESEKINFQFCMLNEDIYSPKQPTFIPALDISYLLKFWMKEDHFIWAFFQYLNVTHGVCTLPNVNKDGNLATCQVLC